MSAKNWKYKNNSKKFQKKCCNFGKYMLICGYNKERRDKNE